VSPELQSDYRDPVSVRECVATGINSSIGVIPRMGESETRAVSDSLSSVGLDSIASRQIRSLSYGQFRLVLLARALVLKPRVLLLDEALGGLDAANRDQMLGVFRRLAAAGTSIVIASHEGVPDPGLFTHSLELSDGRIRHARPV
jgi:molybdate transport system ATP-binding protein